MGHRLTACSLSALATLALLLGAPAPEPSDAGPRLHVTPLVSDSQFDVRRPHLAPDAAATSSATRPVSVIVKLDDEPVASYAGRIPGLAATNARATGRTRLDMRAPATAQYRAHLRAKHDAFAATAARTIPGAALVHRFDVVLGGVSLLVPADKVGALRAVPGVKAVYPDSLLHLDTDRSPAFIGAPALWSQLGGAGSAGEGVIVGVLDSGVWPEHPSFSDPDPLGKPYAAPPAPPAGTRACDFAGGANPGAPFACNNKLIGARRIMSAYDVAVGLLPTEFTAARDDDGHGTHVASTAAGNRGVAAIIQGHALGTVSGVAPRAHVIAYKICGIEGCLTSDAVAAVQRAIQDGVDVINFSISGGNVPYADAVELAFLDAYAAGVFVAASAGNNGPGSDTVGHRGPWVTTVAASSSDRQFVNTATLTAGNGDTLLVTGTGISEGVEPAAPVVLASTLGNESCQSPFAPGSVAGMVVACDAFGSRLTKSFNVADAGGVGMLMYGPETYVDFVLSHWVPTVHLLATESDSLVAFLTTRNGVTASISDAVAAAAQGDRLASFSSRGGPAQVLGVSKPDITAPGLRILAGQTPAPATPLGIPEGDLFLVNQGTSMASPHAAGAAALLSALHPTWTPGQIKSALMTTARAQAVVKEDGTTPFTAFDAGSGRIDLSRAGDPGLTFDVPAAKYLELSDHLWETNYPSVYVPIMPGVITVHRTARSHLTKASVWNVRVASAPSDVLIGVPTTAMEVSAEGELAFAITVDARAVPLGEARHAVVELHDGARTARLPITIVRRQPAVTLAKNCSPTSLAISASTTCTISMANTDFEDAPVNMTDALPAGLMLVPGTVTGGAAASNNAVTFTGTLAAATPTGVLVAAGPSPGGYQPLSGFGVAPLGGVGDETILNLDVPPFVFGGETYTRIGFASNGYAVLGGGTHGDLTPDNQGFPNANPPNNVLAPFWTDLVPGALRAGIASDGDKSWIVLDWEGMREFGSGKRASFQIWIGINGTEDVSYAYGPIEGNGALGLLTVGAENRTGNRGANVYVNGTGALPTSGTELRVSTVPGASGETRDITFEAKAVKGGPWTACAEMTSELFAGTSTACVAGTVTGQQLPALGPVKVWLGLANSDGVGLRVDLAAEVRLGQTVIGSGELRNVATGGSGFNNALLQSIPLTSGVVAVPAGATLTVTVKARRTCFATSGHNSGTVRLWYDGRAVDTGSTRDAGSRVDATTPQAPKAFYLRTGAALSETAGTARTSVDAAVNNRQPCTGGGRPYTPFGTWSMTLP